MIRIRQLVEDNVAVFRSFSLLSDFTMVLNILITLASASSDSCLFPHDLYALPK